MKEMRILLPALLLASGCTVVRVQPMSVDTVIERHKSGVAADRLIADIEVAGTRYYLKVADVVRLREAGVPDELIDRMLASAWRPPRVYYYYDDPFLRDPYWRLHPHPHW